MAKKYAPLVEHLKEQTSDLWRATFTEIEKILGSPLPASARNYPAWWANEKGGSAQRASWTTAGWQTENLNLTAGRVDFRRVRNNIGAINHETKKASRSQKKDLFAPPDAGQETKEETTLDLRWKWLRLGSVSLDTDGRLKFPPSPIAPGVYRLVIEESGTSQCYVGESENLMRRFGHYRRPGPTQHTSIRINRELQTAAQRGAAITLQIVSNAYVDIKPPDRLVDLNRKVERRLLENAVLTTEGGKSLNL